MKYHRHKQISQKSPQSEKKNVDGIFGKEKVQAYTLSTDAKGIAKLSDGSIVFVDNLLPNERATIQIHTQKSTYKRASVLKIESSSKERVPPPCSYYDSCGGCQLQHIKQEKQVDFKIQWFFETLKRVGKWDKEHISFAEKKISIVFLKTSSYRRRIRLHFDGKNLGFHAQESNKIINISACYIARLKLNEKLNPLKTKLIAFYPELQKMFMFSKLEFDIELTESDDDRVLMHFMNFKSASSKKNISEQEFKRILNKHFEIQDDQLIHLKHPKLGRFKIKKESFLQPHIHSIESYYNIISNCCDLFLKSTKLKHKISSFHAWDLYAGSGIFSCIPYFSAKKFGLTCETTAVEGVAEAIESLKLNYKDHPVSALIQDVYQFIEMQFQSLSSAKNSFNKVHLVIVDPPRSGIGIPTMQRLVELCAQESCVLYLACDPASFARDTQILLEGGFTCKQIFLFDSFGQTNFYEVLGCFSRGV